MEYTISEDRQKLVITIDEAEQLELTEAMRLERERNKEGLIWDTFESLLNNSDLDWIDAEETGDLTEAPMLGFHGETFSTYSREMGYGLFTGRYENDKGVMKYWFEPVTERWAFMDYQVDSLIEKLAENRTVTFTC